MDKPYLSWEQSSATHGGDLVRNSSPAYPEYAVTTTREAIVRPKEAVYAGRLILLIDRRCTSGCEDFVMPFKTARRATLIGETTGGTFSDTARADFGNGMLLNVTAVRHSFPDGSRFEGVGIAPHLSVSTTAEDLKASRDQVLRRALEMATP
jgi:C-terminal processing protease CtpA/Prc